MKYIIAPADMAIEIEADSKEQAMSIFAENMDNSMNTYFKAIPHPKYKGYVQEQNANGYYAFVKEDIKNWVNTFIGENISCLPNKQEILNDLETRAFEVFKSNIKSAHDCSMAVCDEYIDRHPEMFNTELEKY